jgi:hypothetical protein
MLDSNPVLHTAKPKLIDRPPDIFTVDECSEKRVYKVNPKSTATQGFGVFFHT